MILNQRAMLLVKAETTSGVDAVPVPSLDACYVIAPEFGGDVKFMERKFSRRDFSTWPAIAGRRMGTLKFSVEFAPSGVAGTPPTWTRLLTGCGCAGAVQTTVSKTITTGVRALNVITFTTSAAHGWSVGNTITAAGATGDLTFNGTFVIASVPSSTTLTVASAGTTGSGTFTAGTLALVAGTLFTPITDNQTTVTLYLYYDGLLHKITGAMGNFSLSGTAGDIGDVAFTFSGVWNDPINVGTFPTGDVYNTVTNVPLVQYANMAYNGDNTLVASAFKFDIQNKLFERQDMNQASGWRGMRISERNPTGGIDPEVDLTALSNSSTAMWTNMTNAILGSFSVTVGNNAAGVNPGYSMILACPNTQLIKNTYKDRDNLRVYDLSMTFRRLSAMGNDEFSLLFT